MKPVVYRGYLKDDIISKTAVLASVFGLSINSFKTADEYGEYPYRIRFYHGNNIVGYMDSIVDDTYEIPLLKHQYPFTLFTPIGNVSGVYSHSLEEFSYQLDVNHSDELDSIAGRMYVLKRPFQDDYGYDVGFSIQAQKNNKRRFTISTNGCGSNSVFEIFDYQNSEQLCLERFNEARLSHITQKNKWDNPASKIIFFDDEDERDAIMYFSSEADSSFVPVKDESGNINYLTICQEIEKHDKSYFDFINKIKEDLTFYTYARRVPLYDNMLNLSYKNNLDSLSLFGVNKIEPLQKDNSFILKYRR